jgi:FAD/FMN-containing dehydrogenase
MKFNLIVEEKIPFAVRSGGAHDMAGMSTIDGGIVIDLSLMKGIYVDLDKKTVKVEPGTLVREVDHELLDLGYVTLTGKLFHNFD